MRISVLIGRFQTTTSWRTRKASIRPNPNHPGLRICFCRCHVSKQTKIFKFFKKHFSYLELKLFKYNYPTPTHATTAPCAYWGRPWNGAATTDSGHAQTSTSSPVESSARSAAAMESISWGGASATGCITVIAVSIEMSAGKTVIAETTGSAWMWKLLPHPNNSAIASWAGMDLAA